MRFLGRDERSPIEIDWLKRWHTYAPQRVAIKDGISGREYAYQELWVQAQAIASSLRNRYGVGAGDRVAVLATNRLETVFLFFALQRLGAILVPINFRLTGAEVTHILEDCGARLLFLDQEFNHLLPELPASDDLLVVEYSTAMQSWKLVGSGFEPLEMNGHFESPVMILYTSGTTGKPKGAIITHKMIFWNSVSTWLRLNLTAHDVSLMFLPFFHTGGWNVLTTPLLHVGGKLIFLPKFEPEQVLEVCEREDVTILFGVPTTMEMMARTTKFSEVKLQTVRYAIVGGEPMPLEAIRTWHHKGIPIRQGYGLTEFGPNVFSLNEEHSESKMGSIGFANFYVETQVVDDLDLPVAVGDIGELCLRGPACTPGYWNHPEATAETMRGGWLHTGDLVRQDQEGFFYVVGRKKDMYISGGENVYPAEIERVLRSHEKVLEAAVIGVPDAQWGEAGKAFVVAQPGSELDETELRMFCQKHLAKFKVPKFFVRVAELPKGDTGKILKRALSKDLPEVTSVRRPRDHSLPEQSV